MSSNQQQQQPPQASPAGAPPPRATFVEQVTYASGGAFAPDPVASDPATMAAPGGGNNFGGGGGAPIHYYGGAAPRIESMAPPSFTPDFPDPPSGGAMTGAAGDDVRPLAVASSSEIVVATSGKLCTHVERNEMKPSTKGGSDGGGGALAASAAAAAAEAISSAVERTISSAEEREAGSRESALANGVSPNGGRAFEHAALHGGPFTALELGQLALHCAPCAVVPPSASLGSPADGTAADSGGVGENGNSSEEEAPTCISGTGAWCAVDGDSLATLVPMLQSHVKSAIGIDLVREGRGVISRMNEERESGRPAISVQQVS